MNNKTVAIAIAALLASCMTACDDADSQQDQLESALEEAWKAAEKPVNQWALSSIKEQADNPSGLGKNFQAEWNSTFDVFTLTNPIDYSSRAAMSLFLGEWGDSFNDIESYARDNFDKKAVMRSINNNFNDNWATLFVSLVALDGSFTYDVETDGWSDNSFDFESEDIYKILKEKGYFQAGQNRSSSDKPSADTGSRPSGTNLTFTMLGKHELTGNFIYKSQKFPVEIDYLVSNADGITDCVYRNLSQGTTLNLQCTGGSYRGGSSDGYFIRLEGKDLTINLNLAGDKLIGKATSGGSTLDVELVSK